MIDKARKDAELIQEIVNLLSGKEWDVDTLDVIAALLTARGYAIEAPRTEEDDLNAVL